ncbi:MAG: ABC transporter permease [Bacillaceae bacterium]
MEKSPSGFTVVWKEFKKDKLAMGSLILLVCIVIAVYGTSLILNLDEVVKVDFLSIYLEPSGEHLLGTDYGGRDVFGQLIIGTRNSFTIGFFITLFSAFIGVTIGLLAGYFGGIIDSIIMRIIDFMLILPFLMFVIVFVSVIPKFNIYTFIGIMTIFLWTGIARLIRSKVLSESQLDYVIAAKALGTPNWKIILSHVLPNISSLVIVTFTLNLAGNIGIETGLTYLGFGLPESTPSLGTLVSYASNPDVLQNKWWVWVPASVMILVLMLSINFIGEALKRSADARQRRG